MKLQTRVSFSGTTKRSHIKRTKTIKCMIINGLQTLKWENDNVCVSVQWVLWGAFRSDSITFYSSYFRVTKSFEVSNTSVYPGGRVYTWVEKIMNLVSFPWEENKLINTITTRSPFPFVNNRTVYRTIYILVFPPLPLHLLGCWIQVLDHYKRHFVNITIKGKVTVPLLLWW